VPASDATAIFPQRSVQLVSVEIPATESTHAAEPCFSFADTPRLTAALGRGDEEAFRFLHTQWNARLMRYCFALTAGEEALAHELAQGVYLRILRHIGSLPDEGALWGWITCAARSAVRDLSRVGGRYRRALARFGDWLYDRMPRQVEEDPLMDALEVVLAELAPDDRALIEARYFERVTLEQIGERLSASTRAIEGRLARLRTHLRERIKAARDGSSRIS
jgi:RNA polymerase sigma factor (sigma-70 family)